MQRISIGVDLGATNTKIGLVTERGKVLIRQEFPTKRYPAKEILISKIIDAVNSIRKLAKLKNFSVMGVGIGVPGPVEFSKGIVHYLPNIPGWEEVNLRRRLERRINLPIYLDNDANLMALAEAKLGSGRNYRNLICLTLGSGVGGGIILEGNLYRGSSFSAGEIGHMPINVKGPRCNCGSEACLERYVGNKYIAELAFKMFGRRIPLEELKSMAYKGNVKARGIWVKVADYLSVALVGLVNVFNPERIIIGGGIAEVGPILFSRINEVIKRRAMKISKDTVRVIKARLGKDAGIIGAAILAKEGAKR